MLYVYKSEVRVAAFETCDDLQYTGLDLPIEKCRIVWTLIFEAKWSKAKESVSYNCQFLNACSESRRISDHEQDVYPERSADNVTRSYFRHYQCREFFVELLFSKPSKSSVSLTVLLSCNLKGLVFDFYWIKRETNVGWRRINSYDLFTYQ